MQNVQYQTKGWGNTRNTAFRRGILAGLVLVLCATASATTKAKTALPVGSNIEVSATLADAVKAVEEVVADPVVHGTYVYEKDKILIGARQTDHTSAFGSAQLQGKVFFKVIDDVLAPRHFKNSEDSGTITVRYIVKEMSSTSVGIRVDAVFVESARRAVHPSEGAVESAEFGEIQQHLNRIQEREKEALEDMATEQQAKTTTHQPAPMPRTVTPDPDPATEVAAAPVVQDPSRFQPSDTNSQDAASGSAAELEQRVNRLRHQVEARVKAGDAPLKSAPFHTATTIQTVPAGAEVAIVILTTYWYGVQTTDGHTGWIQRNQLEPLP